MITLDKKKCNPLDLLVGRAKQSDKEAIWQAIRSNTDEMWDITIISGDQYMGKAIFAEVCDKEVELLPELGWDGK